MKTTCLLRLLAVAGLSLGVASASAAAAEITPKDTRGVPVGSKAPAFSLDSADGQKVSLEDLLQKGKVALVFYRSADW